MKGLLKTRHAQSAFGSTAANLVEAVAGESRVETCLVCKAGILSLIALALGHLRSHIIGTQTRSEIRIHPSFERVPPIGKPVNCVV